MITVSNKIEVKRLLVNSFYFRKIVKKVEKYWKAGPRSVYMRYCGISHKRQDNYRDRLERYVICAKAYLINMH